MRLSSDLIRNSPSYVNPIKEREINLRGYKISIIENLGVTQDQYETLDLSDNEILKLDNFPILKRLTSLLLNNNRIKTIATGLGQFIPKIQTLILTNNRIASLQDLEPLTEFKDLGYLSLLQNPVQKHKNYRLFLIHKLPNLKVLDYQKVKRQEREEAKKLFKDKVDSKEKQEEEDHPMEDGMNGTKPVSTEDRALIMEQIQQAKSMEEVDRLEKLASGLK